MKTSCVFVSAKITLFLKAICTLCNKILLAHANFVKCVVCTLATAHVLGAYACHAVRTVQAAERKLRNYEYVCVCFRVQLMAFFLSYTSALLHMLLDKQLGVTLKHGGDVSACIVYLSHTTL
jgi:hypothetical protein